jgi:hypothetical protein
MSFAAGCTAIVVAVLATLWLSGVFGDLGLSLNGVIALLIGITLTVLLGVGLMALVFYSGRSHHDEAAHQDIANDKPRWSR